MTFLFPFQELLDARIVEWRPNEITVTLTVDARHLDAHGLVANGVLVSLLDIATGLAACHCAVPGNIRRAVTLNLTTQFLKPAGAGLLTAAGRVLACDGKIVLGEATVRGPDGEVVAVGQARMRYLAGSDDPNGHPPESV